MIPEKKTIKISKSRKVVIFIILTLMAFGLINFISSSSKLISSQTENFIKYPEITDTYIDLLSESSRSYIKPSYTYYKKNKAPIATYLNTKTGGKIIIYKIDTITNIQDLNNKLILDSLNIPETSNMVYESGTKSNNWQLMDKQGSKLNFNNIYLSIEGANITKTIYSDSLIYYSCLLKKMYIQADKKSKAELFIQKRKKISFSNPTPVEFAFKVKNNAIYLIFNGDLDENKSSDLLKIIH